MRETQFSVPFDVPRGSGAKRELKYYLTSMAARLGGFGAEGQDVGIGFIWRSRTGLVGITMAALSRRMLRALIASHLVSPRAEPYHLEQRVTYIRDGDPCAVFRLREGVKESA